MTRSGHLRAGATKWKNVHLKSTAQFINGRAFKPSEWATRGLPIVRIQNLTNSTNTYNYCDFPVDPKHVIGDGQLLFAWSGTLGAFIWRGGKAVLNQHIFRVEVNSEIINKMYLYYVLNYKTINFAKKTHGTGMTHITKSKFENSEIPLPTVAEQRRVVAKIESIFAEIDSAMTVFQDNGAESIEFKLDRLRRSILSKEVSPSVQKTHRKVKSHNTNWENIILSKLAHINTSNTLQHVNQKSLIHIGLEHILSNLNKIKGYSDTQNVKTYRLFQKGDILYGRLRPNLNKVWLATTNGHCSTDILPLTANPTKILPQFLLYVMSSHQFVQKATMGSSGVGMPRIRWNVLQDFVLAVPPLAEQRTIVKKIESIFAKIDAEICNRLTWVNVI